MTGDAGSVAFRAFLPLAALTDDGLFVFVLFLLLFFLARVPRVTLRPVSAVRANRRPAGCRLACLAPVP